MRNISVWLVNAGHTLEFYLRPSKCKESVPLALGLLSSEEPWARTMACKALGELGDG